MMHDMENLNMFQLELSHGQLSLLLVNARTPISTHMERELLLWANSGH